MRRSFFALPRGVLETRGLLWKANTLNRLWNKIRETPLVQQNNKTFFKTRTLPLLAVALMLACGAQDGPKEAPKPDQVEAGPKPTKRISEKEAKSTAVRLVDRTEVAKARTAWDNVHILDAYSKEFTSGGAVPPQIRPLWARYSKDPVRAILQDGKIDFRIVAALYNTGVITQENRTSFHKKLEAGLKELGADDAVKGNYLIALIHLGFDNVAFKTIEDYRSKAWFKKNWDVNFYAGSLLFRYRKFDQARPFLETADQLHPTKTTKLWLRLARVSTGSKQEGHAVFPFGAHMGGGDKDAFPFVDRADYYGVRRWHLAGALSFLDMNNDSFIDWVANGVYATPELYLYNPGEGYVLTEQAAFKEISNVPPGCIAADFDNDGFTDLYMTRAAWFSNGPNRVLRNVNGSHFEDVTRRSGDAPLLKQNSCGVAALDFDRDGLVDLVVSGTSGGSVRLLKNEGDFVFKDVTEAAGIDANNLAVTVSVAVGDVDRDGWPDIFVNRFSGLKGSRNPKTENDNALYRNLGNGRFVDEAAQRGVAEGTPKGFASWMFDYDNDGDLDILASNFADTDADVYAGFQKTKEWTGKYVGSALYQNDGSGRFVNIGKEAGFVPSSVMGAQFIDFDLDGDFDIILGPGNHPLPGMQPLFIYRNDGDSKFTNITPLDDPVFYGKFHGIAFADLDRDGDPDLFVNNGGVLLSDRWRDLVLENQTQGKTWLHIKLEGVKSNRSAIGATVRAHVEGRVLTQEVASGQGFASTNTPYMIFGLGQAKLVDKLEVLWPSGLKQEFTSIAANQALSLKEGQKEPQKVY